MEKKRLLSGVKPTDKPHLGNYFGAMKQFVDMQNDYFSYIMIADYHALNFIKDKQLMRKNIIDVALDYLAIGLNPKKVVIFKQSDIPEHTELTWIFDTIITMPFLMRAHAFKDALSKKREILMESKNYLTSKGTGVPAEQMFSKIDEDALSEINVGTFNYPILMAADILLYDIDVVPIGQDQKQHLEYTRDTAIKFNNIFGQTFKLPEEKILTTVSIVPGTDGRKMSKSYGNTITLFASDEEIKKAVMGIVTDSKLPEDSKNPDKCNIFALHKLFLKESELESLRQRYLNGGLSYKESKEMLIKEITDFIKPMRDYRNKLSKNPQKVIKILEKGAKIARKQAQKKMAEVKNKIGVNF